MNLILLEEYYHELTEVEEDIKIKKKNIRTYLKERNSNNKGRFVPSRECADNNFVKKIIKINYLPNEISYKVQKEYEGPKQKLKDTILSVFSAICVMKNPSAFLKSSRDDRIKYLFKYLPVSICKEIVTGKLTAKNIKMYKEQTKDTEEDNIELKPYIHTLLDCISDDESLIIEFKKYLNSGDDYEE